MGTDKERIKRIIIIAEAHAPDDWKEENIGRELSESRTELTATGDVEAADREAAIRIFELIAGFKLVPEADGTYGGCEAAVCGIEVELRAAHEAGRKDAPGRMLLTAQALTIRELRARVAELEAAGRKVCDWSEEDAIVFDPEEEADLIPSGVEVKFGVLYKEDLDALAALVKAEEVESDAS